MEDTNIIEVILNKYEEYLKSKVRKPKQLKESSAHTYRNQLKSVFCVREAFQTVYCEGGRRPNANAAMNFLDLMPKLINNYNRTYGLYQLIEDTDTIRKKYNWTGNGKKNLNTYLHEFLKYVETVSKGKLSKTDFDFRKECQNLKITPADKALLEGVEGELYTYNVLKTKFKSRLRSQDRVSGDKIWLPIRFIAKLFSAHVKKEKSKKNAFLNWLNSSVEGIYIHYKEDNSNQINHVKFGSNVSLRLEKEGDNQYKVYVIFLDEKGDLIERNVMTPTGKGNEKTKMVVAGINAIAIDHVIPIDKTLRDLEGSLSELKKVSSAYKELQEQDEPNEDKAIQGLIVNLDFKELSDELNLIKDNCFLRLMASKYNTQKSNSESFKKIIKNDDDSYWGILEEEIYKKDETNPSLVLYQDLSDNGKTRVMKKCNIMGKSIVTISKENIDKMIDLI